MFPWIKIFLHTAKVCFLNIFQVVAHYFDFFLITLKIFDVTRTKLNCLVSDLWNLQCIDLRCNENDGQSENNFHFRLLFRYQSKLIFVVEVNSIDLKWSYLYRKTIRQELWFLEWKIKSHAHHLLFLTR